MKNEFYDLADELERECGDWQNAEGLSAEAKRRLFERVEQLEKEKNKKKTSLLKRLFQERIKLYEKREKDE